SPAASQDAGKLALLYELPLLFARGGSWCQLLQETISRLARVLPAATHAALLVKDRSGELLLEAHVPDGTPAVSLMLARRVFETKEAFLWKRGKDDPSQSLDTLGVHSGIYAPLVWQDDVLGVVCVSTAKANAELTHEDMRLV